MTRRRFIADTWTPGRTAATLTGDQAHHLAHVLRAAPGQVYDIVAGGFLHRAEIAAITAGSVVFELKEELEADSALPLHLLLAVFKFDHLEWGIEKATELGVARITPILAHRTEKHLAQSSSKRVDRWRRIAHEAAKQSRRADVPEIAAPTPLKAALEQENATTRLLLSEIEQSTTLAQALSSLREAGGPAPDLSSFAEPGLQPSALARRGGEGGAPAFPSPAIGDRVPHPSQPHREGWVPPNLTLAIGPEGGWTPEEMALFTLHHWQHVTLGPRILRAETAAIAAIAITGAYLLSLDSQAKLNSRL